MKTVLALGLVLLAAGGALAVAVASRETPDERPLTLTEVPASALAVELLAAVPFAVDEPFAHEWRAEQPPVSAGYLLKLRVDPELSRPRQTYEPVLFVGAETAERCLPVEALVPPAEGGLAPVEQGILVALVPAPLAPDGSVALDLDTAPIWFGSLELPERVDAARIAAELASARARGARPARRAPGLALRNGARDTVHVRSRRELEAYVVELLR